MLTSSLMLKKVEFVVVYLSLYIQALLLRGWWRRQKHVLPNFPPQITLGIGPGSSLRDDLMLGFSNGIHQVLPMGKFYGVL